MRSFITGSPSIRGRGPGREQGRFFLDFGADFGDEYSHAAAPLRDAPRDRRFTGPQHTFAPSPEYPEYPRKNPPLKLELRGHPQPRPRLRLPGEGPLIGPLGLD